MSDHFAGVNGAARAAFGAEPAWHRFVPGRLEVFGKHTDYAGGRSLVAAVPRGVAVAMLPADDGRIVVLDAISGERFEWRPGVSPRSGWRRYIATVADRLSANFPAPSFSARVVLASDLPRAAGISSSSALMIAVAEALVARAGLEARDEWRAAIRSPEDRAAYFGCIENGASFGPLSGDAGVGTHGGSEDHAAILLGHAGCLQQCSFSPLRVERRVTMPAGWTFVVANSGVHAAKTGAAQREYNRLADNAAAIASAWRTHHPDDPRTLAALAREGALEGFALPPALAARLDHFVREDGRVPDAADAFARGDVARIGALAEISQQDAERLLGNQVPETIDLVSLARGLGAPAASAFGAGWGGSVWALVPADEAAGFLEHWLRAYRARHSQRQPDGFISPPADGALRGRS